MPTIRLLVTERDITELRADAIVNSADPMRLGRGEFNGQIHQVTGPKLLGASRALRGHAAGSVKLTLGFGLPARYVQHVISPTAHGTTAEEQDLLAQCYRRYLEHDAILDRVIVTINDDRGYDLSNLAKDLLGYYMDEGWILAGAWDRPIH